MQRCSLGHSPPSNLPCIKGCILLSRSQCRERAMALHHSWGDRRGSEAHQWSPCSADSQESAWSMGHDIPDHHRLLRHHLGTMDVKYHLGFCKMISLSLFSIILGHNLKEWKTISACSIILPCGFSYWFEDKLLVPKLLDAWMHI